MSDVLDMSGMPDKTNTDQQIYQNLGKLMIDSSVS